MGGKGEGVCLSSVSLSSCIFFQLNGRKGREGGVFSLEAPLKGALRRYARGA